LKLKLVFGDDFVAVYGRHMKVFFTPYGEEVEGTERQVMYARMAWEAVNNYDGFPVEEGRTKHGIFCVFKNIEIVQLDHDEYGRNLFFVHDNMEVMVTQIRSRHGGYVGAQYVNPQTEKAWAFAKRCEQAVYKQ